jgi:nitrogen fixation protein FixH
MNAQQPTGRPGKGYFRWPMIVVGLLAVHVGLMLWVATIAVKSGAGQVIPNAYEKSLKWDQEKAARLTTNRLP